MNFVQLEFLWFMAIVFVLYWTARTRRLQNVLLVVASCVFYGWVHPWFLGLLFVSAFVDYGAALGMKARPERRGLLLALSMTANLGMLAAFKYTNFFLENWIAAAELLGVTTNLTTLSIILPVGISFYTFQTMSYTIDVYRGELEPRRDLLDYLLYITFFPQLVAGPIERATRLLPQVESPRELRVHSIVEGFGLAMWGAFKKVCLADTIAPYVDKVFILEDPAGPLVWAGAIGFMMQIYADFSGYTDIARGTARMLGFELTENFRSPYLAATTPEFWQRWHISLSFWIRDYLMVPLLGSGSRLSTPRYVAATITTFVVIGFWHGAAWHFILFGAFHGVWMTAYTLVNRVLPSRIETWSLPARSLAIAFHLLAVSIPGSLLFRETHVERIFAHVQRNPFAATEAEWVATAVVLGMAALVSAPLVVSFFVERYVVPNARGTVFWLPMQTSAWAAFAVAMFVFFRVSGMDFIYFQF